MCQSSIFLWVLWVYLCFLNIRSIGQIAVWKIVVSFYRSFCSLAFGRCYKTITRLPKPHTTQSPIGIISVPFGLWWKGHCHILLTIAIRTFSMYVDTNFYTLRPESYWIIMIYATFRLQMTYRGKLMDDFCLKHLEPCNILYFIALQRFQTAKWPIRQKRGCLTSCVRQPLVN